MHGCVACRTVQIFLKFRSDLRIFIFFMCYLFPVSILLRVEDIRLGSTISACRNGFCAMWGEIVASVDLDHQCRSRFVELSERKTIGEN